MKPHLFSDVATLRSELAGQKVAIVGSGPGVLENEPGFIDSHDVVVRVNNYKTSRPAGVRTDVHYSFYGGSIRKGRAELIGDGVRLCVNKCPDAQFIESEWHRINGKMEGVDFRYIYRRRAEWWFCPTFVPSVEHFLRGFKLLGGHIPTTGFSAILDVLDAAPSEVYITGFDFFTSGVHNVNEPWRAGRGDDPIGHVPAVELAWLRDNLRAHPISCDKRLADIIEGKPRAVLDI
jgi:hypothetical protein